MNLKLPLATAAMLGQALNTTGDTFFATGNNSTLGTSPTLSVGGVGPYQSLVQFDRMTLPAGTTAASITRANLILFVNQIGTSGALAINAANGAWSETTVPMPKTPLCDPGSGQCRHRGLAACFIPSWNRQT